jgi:hypothetical protein
LSSISFGNCSPIPYQRENCFGTDDSDASYFDFNKIPNNIEIDDPVLSENDCVVNKSFNVLNTISFCFL